LPRFPAVSGLRTALVGVSLLLVSFALPAFVAVRSATRITEIRGYAARTELLAQIQGRLQGRIVDDASTSLLANALIVDAMRAALAELAATGLADEAEGERLAELRSVVARRSVLPPEVILEGIVLMQALEERETARQAALLEDLRQDAAREVRLAVWGFLTISAVAVWFLWMRVVRPLQGLGYLLTRVAEGRFEVAPIGRGPPFMAPVFDHYNRLVTRLEELEAAHRQRAESLEESVRAASSALIEQHQALARSERLAAVGETSAGVAHELRNPLAGAALALENLQQEVDDPEIASRLRAVAGEIGRAVRALNDYLRSARHAPEALEEVRVGELVTELAELLRYQAPANVRLNVDVEGDLVATLPAERLRGALMNLVLNAFQAMEGSSGEVRVSARDRDGKLELRVEDEGPGFGEEMLSTGVRPFATGREGGTGLGLAIVRRAAQDFGGHVDIYNRAGGGAGVCLTLPYGHA